MATAEIKLTQIGPVKFTATNPAGKMATIDGPFKSGGTEDGLRPMEMVLAGLAGCSSFDVVEILKKTKQNLEKLEVEVKGERADSIPAVFTHIHLHFIAHGEVALKHFEKAVKLSLEKYCSVASMLNKTATIEHSCEVR